MNKRKQAIVVQVSKQPEILEGKKTLEIKGNQWKQIIRESRDGKEKTKKQEDGGFTLDFGDDVPVTLDDKPSVDDLDEVTKAKRNKLRKER